MSPNDQFYTSAQIATLTGLSLRQLQWWDERKVLMPRHAQHRRYYDRSQALEALILSDARRRGVTLQCLRKILAKLRKMKPEVESLSTCFLVIESGGNATIHIADGATQAASIGARSKTPVLLIGCAALFDKLDRFKSQPVEAPRMFPRREGRRERPQRFTQEEADALARRTYPLR